MKEGFLPIAIRSIMGRCPHCGHGRLFTSYLKQVDQCAHCNEALGHIRADDGPAWLTILIVGHILAFLMLNIVPNLDWPDWGITVLIMNSIVILSLLILPRAKGLFIGIIWRLKCSGSERGD